MKDIKLNLENTVFLGIHPSFTILIRLQCNRYTDHTSEVKIKIDSIVIDWSLGVKTVVMSVNRHDTKCQQTASKD